MIRIVAINLHTHSCILGEFPIKRIVVFGKLAYGLFAVHTHKVDTRLIIIERVRPLLFYISIVGLVLSSVLLLFYLFESEQKDHALASMGAMLLIGCLIGCGFKRIVYIDSENKELITKYNLLFDFAKQSYDFDKISTVHVRKEFASTQGADMNRNANTSRTTPLYIVYADLKAYGRGSKKRVRIKKCFKEEPAEVLVSEISSLIRVSD